MDRIASDFGIGEPFTLDHEVLARLSEFGRSSDDDFLPALIAIFLKELERRLDKMRSAMAANDAPKLSVSRMRSKAPARTRRDEAARSMRTIEVHAAGGSTEKAPILIQALEQEANRVRLALAARIRIASADASRNPAHR